MGTKAMRTFRDQYGNTFKARTIKELREQIDMGGSRVGKMYRDKPDGPPVHIGYVIGSHWLTEWAIVERKA